MDNPPGSSRGEPQHTQRGGVLLALRFHPRDEDPRCEEIAHLLDEVEAIYRAAPAAAALGLPVAELVRDYRIAHADALAEELPYPVDPRAWSRLRRRLPFPEFEEFFFLLERAQGRGRDRRYGSLAAAPEHPLRVREMSMRSPLDFVAHVPSEYWQGGGFLLFLAAIERYFNMDGRIRTERLDLRAKRAERRADEAEAELREERARRELDGLRTGDSGFRLVSGEVRHDDVPGPEA
jgi:hypothetical protein